MLPSVRIESRTAFPRLAFILQASGNSACTLQHLLKTVLAVGVCLLQVILLLVQIGHLLSQSLSLRLQTLLYVWNRRAHKPNVLLLLPSRWGGVTGAIHLSNALVHFRVGWQ
jgi:hypothetical protein